jgi:hypothetical protein
MDYFQEKEGTPLTARRMIIGLIVLIVIGAILTAIVRLSGGLPAPTGAVIPENAPIIYQNLILSII